jgi:hypothetical protein
VNNCPPLFVPNFEVSTYYHTLEKQMRKKRMVRNGNVPIYNIAERLSLENGASLFISYLSNSFQKEKLSVQLSVLLSG